MSQQTLPLKAKAVSNIELAKVRREYSFHDSDGERIQGLRLMVTSAGGRTWYYRYKHNGSARRIRLEEFKPHHFNDDQRPRLLSSANDLRLARERGETPSPDYQKRQVEARERDHGRGRHRSTLAVVVRKYLVAISDPEDHEHYKKSWREDSRILEKDVVPILGTRILAEVTREELRELFRLVKKRGPVIANRTQACVVTLLNWAVDEGVLEFNPGASLKKVGGAEKGRDRALDEDEICVFWHGVTSTYRPTYTIRSVQKQDAPRPVMSEEHALALKILLLTGCRRSEVALARWQELNFRKRLWEIPADRTKTGSIHVVPLNKLALGLIQRLRRLNGTTGYWLSTKRPEVLSHALINARKRGAFGNTPDFAAHDLRRTVRTLITTLGVSRETAERLLGHQIGTRVERTYDRYSYLKEKHDALERWATFISQTVRETAQITALKR